MKTSQIQIRDPFVLALKEDGKYYLYGTTDKNCWSGKATGFDAYSGNDLENWEGPFHVFVPASDFWADRNFWAPEVYQYNGRYYMFASFKAEGACRGTQILVSEKPLGPFVPHSDGPVTPRDWECLDGTFYMDESGNPWIVFSHEWLQVFDGQICAMRLNRELNRAEGDPHLLFRASEAPWSVPSSDQNGRTCHVTDGPFIYKAKSGSLLLLWSSNGAEGYAMGLAISESGSILGPWKHEGKPLYKKDGGHGMIFRTIDGNLKLTIHTPNHTPDERPVFMDIVEQDGTLVLK